MESFVLCCAGVFITPLWIGLKLVGEAQRGRDSLYLMAALFTLKPLLATPLWVALYGSRGVPTLFNAMLGILPAVVFTTALVILFRPVFAGAQRSKAWTLLYLDWARWGSTLLMTLLALDNSMAGIYLLPVSLLMPTVYAIAAYRITSRVIEYPTAEMAKTR
jgi:hypothetical protein